jgi:predicted amidohydrolase
MYNSAMKRMVNVAAIQMYIEPNDIDANLKKAQQLLENVFAKNSCDLVVFPEDCITGPIPYRLDLVQNEKSNSIRFFQELAVGYNTYIVCGSFIEKIDNKYFNTSLLIDNKGKIILKYQKNNLWIPERWYLTPGNNIKVVKTPLGTIGIIICWDLAFPETVRKLAKLNVDIICCPSYWTKDDGGILTKKYNKFSEAIFVNTLCPARVIENEALFIYANGAGEAKLSLKTKMWKSQQIGQTQICSPVYGTVSRLNDNAEGFVVYEYDRQISKDAEYVYKIRKDLSTKII